MMEKRGKFRRQPQVRRKGIFLLPNLFTSASLFCGFYSIIMASSGRWEEAAIAIFVSLLLDGLDGKVARLTNTTTQFGVEYDSISDVIAFGAAPAFLIYSFSLNQFGRLGLVAAFLFACCGALRLARFNVQVGNTDPRYFVGLPIPAAACTIAALVLGVNRFPINQSLAATGLLLVSYLLSFLMVSNLPYRSLKKFDFRQYPSFNLLVAGVLIFSMFAYKPILMAVIFWLGYLFSGPIMAIIRLRLKSSKEIALKKEAEAEAGKT